MSKEEPAQDLVTQNKPLFLDTIGEEEDNGDEADTSLPFNDQPYHIHP